MADEITVTRIEDDDGAITWVTSDGEILDIPEIGPGALAYAVAQFDEAKRQEKGWLARKLRWQALIVDQQKEARAVYGATLCTLRQNAKTVFDADLFVCALEAAGFLDGETLDAARKVLSAITAIDAERLKEAGFPEFAVLAKRRPTGEYTRTWVSTEPILKDYREPLRPPAP